MEFYLEKFEIVNDKLIIEAWIIKPEPIIEIDFGNNKIKLTPNKTRKDIAKYINNNRKKTSFTYSIPVPFNCHKIIISLKSQNELLTQYILQTSIIKRTKEKMKKIGNILKKISTVLIKNPKIIFSKELRANYKKAMIDRYNNVNNTDLLDINNQKDYVDWIINNEKIINNPINFDISVFIYGDEKKYKECRDRVLSQNKNVKIINENISNRKTIEEIINNCKTKDIILLNSNDIIANNFFASIEKRLNKGADFIYGDNDYLDDHNTRMNPCFKPDYSPDTLKEVNYIGTTVIMKKKLLEKYNQKDTQINIETIHNIFLELLSNKIKIEHISEIIYHSKNKLLNHQKNTNYNTIHNPLISIIIPTRDYKDILEQCVDSILNKTTYNNYEIIIINNGSKEENTLKLFDEYKKNDKIKIIDLDCEFNFSYLNNEAVKKCSGEFVVLLNNDTEIITPNWLEIMLYYASKKHIGAVGAKLLYPDNTIQHGGVILGLGGIASHAYIGEKRDYKGIYNMLTIPHNVSAVTAACLMIKKDKYLEVKGLDEKIKVAFNDVDFCLKLLDKGYYNIILPQVELYHYESKSRGLDTTEEKRKRFMDESDIMLKRWQKYIEKDPFYNPNFSLKRHYKLDRLRKKENNNENK